VDEEEEGEEEEEEEEEVRSCHLTNVWGRIEIRTTVTNGLLTSYKDPGTSHFGSHLTTSD